MFVRSLTESIKSLVLLGPSSCYPPVLHHDHMYQQQQSYPPLVSRPPPPLVDRHYSSPASYSEPIQQTQYHQGYQDKTFSDANLLPSDTQSVQQHDEPTEQTSNQYIPNHLSYSNSYIQPSSTEYNYVQLKDIPHDQLYSREASYSNVLPPQSHQHPPMKYPSHLGCQSELSQSNLHQVEHEVSPTNQYVNSGTCTLSSSLPPASTVAQSIGRNNQSFDSLVVAPKYPIGIVSAQSQPSTPQSRRQQYFNTGHSSSFPPHIPKSSYPNTTQQYSSGVLPQHNLMSPPQVPGLHDEFVRPSRHNLPVHLSNHSSHSPEHMLTDNPTTPYDTEPIMQGNNANPHR